MRISPKCSKSKKKDVFLPKEDYSHQMRKALVLGESIRPQAKRKVNQFLDAGEQTSGELNSDGTSKKLAVVPYLHQQGDIGESSKKSDSMENVICVTNRDPYSELPSAFSTDELEIDSGNSRKENNDDEELSFIDRDIFRAVIPIGPKFQGEVQEWSGGVDVKNASPMKYLGTVVWPLKGEKLEESTKETGKGRPDSCSCDSPGSADCVKRHILEAKDALKSQVGPAFFMWKLDQTGQEFRK